MLGYGCCASEYLEELKSRCLGFPPGLLNSNLSVGARAGMGSQAFDLFSRCFFHTPRNGTHFFIASPGFPGCAVVKNPPAHAGDARDVCLIPGSRRSPEGGNGNPLQCSHLENPMNRSLAGYDPWGFKEQDMTEHAWYLQETGCSGSSSNASPLAPGLLIIRQGLVVSVVDSGW